MIIALRSQLTRSGSASWRLPSSQSLIYLLMSISSGNSNRSFTLRRFQVTSSNFVRVKLSQRTGGHLRSFQPLVIVTSLSHGQQGISPSISSSLKYRSIDSFTSFVPSGQHGMSKNLSGTGIYALQMWHVRQPSKSPKNISSTIVSRSVPFSALSIASKSTRLNSCTSCYCS